MTCSRVFKAPIAETLLFRSVPVFLIIHISININDKFTSDRIRFQRTVFAQDHLRSEVLQHTSIHMNWSHLNRILPQLPVVVPWCLLV